MKYPTFAITMLLAIAFLIVVAVPVLETVRTAMEAGGAL